MNKRAFAAGSRIERGVSGRLRHRVAGQERREVRFCPHGTDSGSATAVRDSERLVQVEVRHVATDVPVAGETEQSVEVSAIDVDLTAGVVNGAGDLSDSVLVHAVSRRVGDHQRRQIVAVFSDFGSKVVNVDVTVVAAGHHNDLHSREHG